MLLMTDNANAPTQLRLIIETDDFDTALRFYRDVLGMPEQLAFATEGDDRVAILHAGIATIELATSAHGGGPGGTSAGAPLALVCGDGHARR